MKSIDDATPEEWREAVKQERTPWFPWGVKPVHVGVYEVQNAYGPDFPALFNFWNGVRWTGAEERIEDVRMSESAWRSAMQDRIWRGLARRPV